ncbi:MAG: riboflavin synthase [Leptospiraceae bacterium]|nr:riboflavin synthase [Leptospiraceae bacterium]
MFTGLVETLGEIVSLGDTDSGKVITINTNFINDDVELGASISVNGCCLTVTSRSKNDFQFYASYKTLELTNLNLLSINDKVNLERSILPSTRMGGHIVQGHVDGIGTILSKSILDSGNVIQYFVSVPEYLTKFIVERGSIAVDGISLTVVSIHDTTLELVLIPETIQKTNASYWSENSIVNLETDIMARYVLKYNSR